MIKNYNFCSKENEHGLFFSLVDYRNNYFINSDPDKIIEFYNSFSDKSQLFDWMKERPKGNYVIKEVEGSTEIIVVIPTIDVDGQYAKNCKDNIFKGLHIIFVESGYDNFYYNYAHNCNAGIKKALEYNPKWIIVSNDDMNKIDDIDVLTDFLKEKDPDDVSIVYPLKNEKHSVDTRLTYMGFTFKTVALFRDITFSGIKYYNILRKKQVLQKKFNCTLITIRNKKYFKILGKPKDTFFVGGALYICGRSLFLNNGITFDDTYINGLEDSDISYTIFHNKIRAAYSNFGIGAQNGSSLGSYGVIQNHLLGFKTNKQNIHSGLSRELRELANLVYFNYKIKNFLD